jgi:putative ABC transport system permease protein
LPDGVLPAYATPSVDWRVVGFATLLTLVCGVVFGLAPALQAQRLTVAEALKEGARSAAGGIASIWRFGAQQALVVSEIALALVLLIAGALMLRSLGRQLAVEPGFCADGVLTAQLSLPRGRYAPAERVRFVNALLARLDALPEVEAAAIGSDVPLGGISNGASFFIDGLTPVPTRYFRHRVTPDYFATLGIPILRGRSFTPADRDSTPFVAVISDAMARRFWPGADPLGRRIRMGDVTGLEATIVGVAGNARHRDLTTNLGAPTTEPDIYVAFAQRSDADLWLTVRAGEGAGNRAALIAAIQREVNALDPGLPLYRVAPMADFLARQTATARFGSTVLGSFSIVALLLASIGIYGVLAFVIGLSRREIAIRMALGASRARVVGLIVRQGMSLVGVGLAIGLVGAYFATALLSTQLFGVTATDPATFAVVAAVLAAVALAASYLPSRSAARIDPQQALKSD